MYIDFETKIGNIGYQLVQSFSSAKGLNSFLVNDNLEKDFVITLLNKENLSKYQNIVRLIKVLGQYDIPVPSNPSVIKVSESEYALKTRFYDGDFLCKCLNDEFKQKDLIRNIIDMLFNIYDIPHKEVEFLSSKQGYKNDWSNFINDNVDRIYRDKNLFKKTNEREVVDEVYQSVNKLTDIERYSFVHGDLHCKNILVKDSQDFLLIDFDLARIGSYLWDLAYFIGRLSHQNDKSRLLAYKYVCAKINQSERKLLHSYLKLFHIWTIHDHLIDRGGSDDLKKNAEMSRIALENFKNNYSR